MRQRSGKIPLIVAAFILAALAAAHLISFAYYPPRLQVSLSSRSVLVGDKITYTMRVMSKSAVEVNIPDLTETLSRFRIIDSGSSKEEFLGRARITAWYSIIQYTPGDYAIGPVTVVCSAPDGKSTKLENEAVRVAVESILADSVGTPPDVRVEEDLAGFASGTQGQEARLIAAQKAKASVMVKIIDIKGPISLLTFIDIILLIAEAALLVFIIDWIVRFVRRRIKDAQRVTPYETACKDLDAVKKAAAKKTIPPWECCAKTSTILKRYIRDAFKMGPSEFTTADFLKAFRALNIASDDMLKAVSGLLSLCDLVKFSGHELSHKDLEGNIDTADAVIKSLHAKETEGKTPVKP